MTPGTETRLRSASPAERDSAIIQGHREGGSLRQIAALVGMSPTGVRKIIERTEEPCPESASSQ